MLEWLTSQELCYMILDQTWARDHLEGGRGEEEVM